MGRRQLSPFKNWEAIQLDRREAHRAESGERLIEIVELDRRQFLRMAGGTLISLGTMGLFGCAGGGMGGSSASNLMPASGTVQLPAGSKSLGALTVVNGVGQTSVSSKGQFLAPTAGANSSLAFVLDSSNRNILLGFLTPSSNNAINAASTAAALIYFALDAYVADPSNCGSLVSLIARHPATSTLASTISARIVANPYALDQSDAQICAGLATAVNAITGGAAIARLTTQHDSPSSAGLVTIDGGTQSGFTVNLASDSSGFTGTNNYRRYCSVYTYETGTIDANGNQTNLDAAQLTTGPMDVYSTERLNLATAIGDVFTGTSPFSPVTTTEVALPLLANTKSTLYEIVVIGSSGSTVDPAFFSFSRYSAQVAGWRSKLSTLNLRSGLGDILFGLILNMIGVTSLNLIPLPSLDQAIANLEKTRIAAFETAIQQTAEGLEYFGPLKAALTIVKGGGVALEEITEELWEYVDFLLTIGNKTAAEAVTEARFGQLIGVGFRSILGAISGASLVLGAIDLGAVIKDLTSSDKGDLWTAVVSQATLHVNPASVTINPGVSSPTAFTVSPPAGIAGTFQWDWTLTGGVTAQVSDGINKGATLDTSDNSVSLITTSLDINNMTLTVQGFLVANGQKTSIGTGKASITVSTSPPNQIPLKAVSGTYTVSTGNDGAQPGNYGFIVGYGFTPVKGAISYSFSPVSLPTITQATINAGATPITGNLPYPLPASDSYGGNSAFYVVGGMVVYAVLNGYAADEQTLQQLIAEYEGQLETSEVATVTY